VLKAIRKQTGKEPGDTIEVVLWRDEEARTVEVPAQFETLMKKKEMLPFFEKLSYTRRKEYCRWITGAKEQGLRDRANSFAFACGRSAASTSRDYARVTG